MSATKSLSRKLSWSLIAIALTSAAVVCAEEEFDVATTPGKVVLKTKGKWHANPEYPWVLVTPSKKIEKAEFAFKDGVVSVAGPKGEATLRGGVCNGDQCRSFHKVVTIP